MTRKGSKVSQNIHLESKEEIYKKVKECISKNIPQGFEEIKEGKLISYVVPHSTYPKGYHVNPKKPLPFLSLAFTSTGLTIYHMGLYSDSKLLDWVKEEYPKHSSLKLDMGKGCIRFKKLDQIPLEFISKLVQKISLKDWISIYEEKFLKK